MSAENKRVSKKGLLLIFLIIVLIALTAIMFALKSNDFKNKIDDTDSNIEMLKFDVDEVESFTYLLKGQSYTVKRDGENWISADDDSLKLNKKAVNAMLSSCSNMKADDKIADNMKDAAKYGLDNPNFMLNIKYKDGKETKIKSGIENAMISHTYVSIEPEGAIYTMEFSPESEFKEISQLKE